MKPWLDDGDVRLYHGSALDVLAALPAESVQTVVTSPPYWGLRDYGTSAWDGGDEGCEHVLVNTTRTAWANSVPGPAAATGKNAPARNETKDVGGECSRCGARRIDAQLGLEPTPALYVESLVAVFREVRRVLRNDGTLWLNLGDSFMPGKQQAGIPWKVAEALRSPYYTGRIRNEGDRIWLAAMVEAEGCMFIHKRKVGQSNGQGYVRKTASYGSGLEVASTDRVVVERCLEIAGIGSICEQSPEQNERRKQTIYRWSLRSNECRDVIRELYPYMIAKQHEARLLIGCPSSGPDAEAAHEGLKLIHQGGSSRIDFPAPAPMWEPGWILRSDIIWAKKNCMPESVTDRPTKAHEYVFLLSKSARYYFDQDAVRESHQPDGRIKTIHAHATDNSHPNYDNMGTGQERWPNGGRNIRSVWDIATQPTPEAHFATFPEELVRRCVLAGSREGDTVLDPFVGSGTTALVARNHGRRSIGVELNEEYLEIAARRLGQQSLLAESL